MLIIITHLLLYIHRLSNNAKQLERVDVMVNLERKENKATYNTSVYMSTTVNGITFYADSDNDHGVSFNDEGGEYANYIQSGDNAFIPHSSMTDNENIDGFLSVINSYLSDRVALNACSNNDDSDEMPY